MGSRVLGGCRALMEAAKANANANTNTKVIRQGGGITKPVPVSPQLGKFLGGVPQASRSLAIKKVWEHIKLHNLQWVASSVIYSFLISMTLHSKQFSQLPSS
ncbi:hypothetical protein CK203_025300 [Vitis vinifera]|uniref:DM2 domain-containing protein n=1 Tax=Vitis vinifera TaxID=29760 RepID=A0A438IZS6_VITVI|nr:hypothetical protein CK203_025300 [Vitis vinifera]